MTLTSDWTLCQEKRPLLVDFITVKKEITYTWQTEVLSFGFQIFVLWGQL